MSNHYDVVIVGAGSAGLSAAKELQRRGISFLVVEGSHRIGGRAYSEEIAEGVWFDLACSYLHHGQTNPFGPIADDLGIPINRARGDFFEHIRTYQNNKELDPDGTARFHQFYEDCHTLAAESAARGEDVSIADLIDFDSEFIVPFAASMAALNAKDIDETSAADYISFYADDDTGSSDIPVPGGYGNLVAAWASDVDVVLNSAVERIDWSGKQIKVSTVKGNITCESVLITVSTGILAANNILFDPVLPDWKVEAYLGLPTGTENKIGLHFDKDVFGEDGIGFHVHWGDNKESAGFDANINGNDTAVIFTGGSHAIWLEKQGQQAGHDFAVDLVADFFGNEIRKHVNRSIVTAWTTEPWTLGSYSCAAPGQAHQRRELARPVDNRLFFAGEATSTGAQATCHGAYLSGRRAASEIADQLRS